MAHAEPGWGDEPSVLIFGNRRESVSAAEAAARSVGARILGTEPIIGALDRLSRQAAVDSILVELDETIDGGTDRLLEWVDHAARSETTRPVISFPSTLIDYVSARISAGRVVLLSDPEVEDRAAQLGLLLAERKHKLHDQGFEADAERLRRLSEEVARIAGALAELSTSARSSSFSAVETLPAIASEARIDAEMVRNLIRLRRLREQFFSKDLFADPAWDMMLDLMAARLEQGRVAVSSLCIAAAVPATTALRWIRTLTEHGLFVRREDPEDGRRIFIELSDSAAQALTAYFQTAHQMGFQAPAAP